MFYGQVVPHERGFKRNGDNKVKTFCKRSTNTKCIKNVILKPRISKLVEKMVRQVDKLSKVKQRSAREEEC